jgi:hypothetical protein
LWITLFHFAANKVPCDTRPNNLSLVYLYLLLYISFLLFGQASYPFGIISLAHAPVNVTDFFIGSINCNPNNADRGAVLFELHKLCATFSASVDINYRLPIKVYYHSCTLRHFRIKLNHGSQNVF